jgi:hypothetical protein
MKNIHNVTGIGGSIIQHSLELPDSDLQLVFDYLFHKQCLKIWETGQVACVRADYTIYPLESDNPKSLWQFESVTNNRKVLINSTFDMTEMVRIASRALTIALALRLRSNGLLPEDIAAQV